MLVDFLQAQIELGLQALLDLRRYPTFSLLDHRLEPLLGLILPFLHGRLQCS